MAARKTYKFLPTVFQTDTNKKFLSATMDQLLSEPELVKLYGYIGRKFAPTFKIKDSYITESSVDRQNYQLEPSVSVRDDQDNITFFNSYVDYLNKIRYYGGFTNNHDRLFNSEYYTFDPLISFDKLINFSQYYWLPDGPDAVSVNSQGIELVKNYTVNRNLNTGRYEFYSGDKKVSTLTLARGGTYTFTVDQPGYPFWIQAELGIDGLLNASPTISSRDVLGVVNNGADQGDIIFNVPQSTAQNRFIEMQTAYNVDYANPIPYGNLHNLTLSQFLAAYPQYAGITGQLDGKHIIFINTQNLSNVGEEIWTARTVKDNNGNDILGWGEGEVVPTSQRQGVWKIQFIDIGLGDPLLRVVYEQDVAINEKVYVKYGLANANKEFYRDWDGFYYQMPLLSSIQDQLYIQDGVNAGAYAQLKIVEYNNSVIDVETDILGQQNYTSPNGVEFTSGLKIQFGNDVVPDTYKNKTYYVEQVGDTGPAGSSGIRLMDLELLVTPEAYVNEYAVNYPNGIGDNLCNAEYITINRASKDLNAWSRNNRWFHRDVIIATAGYNKTDIILDQNKRAKRPIVQFETDIQLYNYGRIGKHHIDILDTTTLDAFTNLDGKVLTSAFGVELFDGMRVLFAADADPLVRDKIYILTLVQYDLDTNNLPTGPKYIKLTIADDGDAEVNDSVVVTMGQYAGSQWWYDGVAWNEAQQKTELQQEPLFDVLDKTGKSFSEYTRSTFKGTKLFGYKKNITYNDDGTVARQGAVDTVLQFPLSYRNFSTQGDIEFNNYFNTDVFNYINNQTELDVPINNGFLQKIRARFELSPKNTWQRVVEESKQYQLLNFVYTGDNNPFEMDITPEVSDSIPYVKVFVNNKYIKTGWTITGKTLTITNTLAVNDNIDVLVYSLETSTIGHYQVPLNLDLNAQNTEIATLTLGQLRNHLTVLDENSTIVEGDVLGISNLRDVDIKQQGGTILQHSSPITLGQLFLVDETANFVEAQRYADREYTKFKNKFLELSISLSGISPTDPVASVDRILTEINKIKNKTFPWFYSDMVPYNTLRNIITYTVFDTLKTDYEITNLFDDQVLSNTAVLIYHNDLQLIKDVDYVFRDDRPAVTINVPLEADDVIKIVEFQNTDGNYIPETPTKLGLWPKFIPRIFEDDTYRTPIRVIQGHDGSITPAFNDYRDDFLLELEKRIYNNIKLPDTAVYQDIFSVIPGKFRRTGYSLDEVNQLVGTSFLNWLGNNKLDFATNSVFDPNDAFTWNYGDFQDRLDGEKLQGSWRACYQYFYDTLRPHITPWEMLGFTVKPDWWESYYGPGPYTGGNKLLWDDLEAGRIRYGTRSFVDVGYGPGIDPNYRRPGLSQVIPVDENGILLSPAAFLTQAFNSSRAQASWQVGQYGPTEYAWRTSSSFPYAIQVGLALAKPAKYFGLLIDTYRYAYNYDVEQFLTVDTSNHIKQDILTFNGDTSSGTLIRSAGYINWIADYLISQGIDPAAKIKPLLKNYQVSLAYKMSGFTDQKYLNILAEQNSPSSTNDSIVIPNENYKVHLSKSTPIDKLVYSGVIVEKTSAGFTVRGYNLSDPFFTIIPSIVNNNATRITVLKNSAVIYKDYNPIKLTVPYGYEFTSQQQIVDFLISYERYLMAQGFLFSDMDEQLGELRNFTLSAKEFLYWVQQGWNAGSILVLSPVANTLRVFTDTAITDGIEDNQYSSRIIDQNFKLVKNNNYNVMRTADITKIELVTEESVFGFAELNLVQYEHVLVFDNSTVFNDIIYKPELGNRQYRLKLIGRKTDNWDGSLSAPGFMYNSGQIDPWAAGIDYLKGDLVEYKDQYYTALDKVIAADEFDFSKWKLLANSEIKKGLLPNFSMQAVEATEYYDAYPSVDNKDQLSFSHGLIGYRPRQYLSDLGITDSSQIEFYKGFIKEKGSSNAVKKMLNAEFNNLTTDINFYEEWAVRIGEYGAVDSNPFVEAALEETVFGINPSIAEFVGTDRNNEGNGIDVFNASQLYRSTDKYNGNIALYRTDNSDYDNDIPTAGYVNIDDVDATIFDLANYDNLDGTINEIGIGYTIWCAKDFSGDWNVYRVTETDNHVIRISNALDGYINIETKLPHGLSEDDVFVVKGFEDTRFDGFYQVFDVIDLVTLQVAFNGDLADLTESLGFGMIFKLVSSRFVFMEDCREFGRPPHGWKVGEKVWIDDDSSTSFAQNQPFEVPYYSWKVYEKAEPYTVKQSLVKSEYAKNDGYGHWVRMSPDELGAVVGNPQTGTFTIVFNSPVTANVGDTLTQLSGANVDILTNATDSLSLVVKYNDGSQPLSLIGTVYINGTSTGTSIDEIIDRAGVVNTFLKDAQGEFSENFVIVPDTDGVKEFGSVVELALTTDNDSILAVAAPASSSNVGYVHIYNKASTSSSYNRQQVIVGDSDYKLKITLSNVAYTTARSTVSFNSNIVANVSTVRGSSVATIQSAALSSNVTNIAVAQTITSAANLFPVNTTVVSTETLKARFGHSIYLNQTGDWLAAGSPNLDKVYIYGLKRFVPVNRQSVSVNNKNFIQLNSAITVSQNDIIRQPATGMEALVRSSGTLANIEVTTLTNLLTTITGNIIVSNVSVSGNLTINAIEANVYPISTTSYSDTASLTLNFVPDPNSPNDANSLLITTRNKTFIPNVDYTLSNVTVTFTANLEADDYSIIQQPYFALLDTKTGNVNSEFGYSLNWSYDGAQIAIGAPNDVVGVRTAAADVQKNKTYIISTVGSTDWTTVGAASNTVGEIFESTGTATGNGVAITEYLGAGSVWVYDRVIEAFKSTGEQDYTTLNPLGGVYKVTIDEVEVNDYFVIKDYPTVGQYTIRFITPPDVGQIIYIETNKFILLEKLIGIDSLEGGLKAIQDNARFGESLTICSNNCAIYIGAPNYDAGTAYNTGAVWKFHNKGRLYGTNYGYGTNPTFNPGDTIRLDNFEVRVNLGLSGNITVNEGDYITQPSSGANVTVVESTTGNYIKISDYLNSNVFVIGTGNVHINGVNAGVTPRLTSLDEFVGDINDANLLGISAVNEANRLRINSDRTVAKNLLRILAGQGTVLADAEMAVFAFMQIIINPFNSNSEYFGTKVKLAPNAYSLVISSGRGTTKQFVTYDAHSEFLYPNALPIVNGEVNSDIYILDKTSALQATATIFDDDSTRFLDNVTQSGSVYIYELYDDPRDKVEHPGRYQYAQQLIPGNLDTGDQLGYAVDIENNFVVISSLTDSTDFPQGGSVYVFQTPRGVRGWTLKRYQQDTVDINSINKLYLYDNQSNVILETLQYIDPAKGKVLGQAEQEITFKTAYDPAMYNRGFNNKVSLNTNVYWSDIQVGQIWWNLDQVRYIDYEQDSLEYRSINWGRLFPGSTIEICEWVISDVLPSQYVANGGDGVPKYPDDSAYVEVTRVDPITNIIGSVYYYWITNKITVDPNNETRRLPTSSIADLIENPKTQNIPYAAIIRNNAIILYNVGPYLSAKNTILHIGYDTAINTQIIHSEYELIQKGNPDQYIPDKVVDKLIDSLSGIDRIGKLVPDPQLSVADRYGISTRPRQSMFVDRLSAINELVLFVNDILLQYPIARQYDLQTLKNQEAEPSAKLNEYDEKIATDVYLEYIDKSNLLPGYRVLVESNTEQDGLWTLHELDANKEWQIIRVQSYKTDLYWNYVDWYAEGYDAAEQIEFVVDTLPDALKLPVAQGDEILVKVNNYGGVNQGWNLLTVLSTGEFQVVGIQNGTIQLKESLGNFADNGLGFGNQDFESNRFDQNPNQEIRNVLYALRDDIFIDALGGEFNNLFFTMVNYLFSEQKYVDWMFKTSFISVTHKLRTLSQFPSYIEDNQTYYQEYINEVKPYRTKIREYMIGYNGEDNYDGHITDFDLPPYYDQNMKVFRSPSGEEITTDSALWLTDPYIDWYNNRKFKVISITVTNPGRGYTQEPLVTIINGAGGGSGATARAIIDGDTGSVIEIIVTDPGKDYLTEPTVIINGSCEETATAYAVIENKQLRSFDTTIKFDRVSYTTSVTEWQANTAYAAGDIITHSYTNGNIVIRTAYIVTANITSGSTFVADDYQVYSANLFTNANDRIWGYYSPLDSMPARDLKQLVKGIDYPGVQVQGPSFNIQPGFGGTALVKLTLSDKVTVSKNDIVTQTVANIAGEIIKASITISNAAINSNVIYGSLNSTVDFEIFDGTAYDIDTLASYYVPIQANAISINESIVNDPDLTPLFAVYQIVFSSNVNVGTIGEYITQASTGANAKIIGGTNAGSIRTISYTTANVFALGSGNISISGTDVEKFDPAQKQIYFDGNINANVGQYITQSLIGSNIANAVVTANAITNSVTISYIDANVFVLGSGNVSVDGITANVYPTASANIGIYPSSSIVIDAKVYPTAVEYVSSTAMTPFDSTSFDNLEYDDGNLPILGDSAVDTAIRSTYTDTNLGLRPEDINVDGGAYVDRYSSHAPEELVPGIVSDTLNMKVYTKINGNTEVLGYRVFSRQFYLSDNKRQETEYLRISDAHSTTLAQPLLLTDTEIVLADASMLPIPGANDAIPGVVFIGSERIVYWYIDYATNTLSQLRRGTHGTPAAAVHLAGSAVIDGSLIQIVPGSGNTEITTTYTNTYTVTDSVTYELILSANITANVGDTITQFTSGTSVTVLGKDHNVTNRIYVTYNSSADFNYLAANIGVTSNLAINGTYTSNIYPVSSSMVGNTYPNFDSVVGYGIDANGDVTVLAGNVIVTNVWHNTGAGTATDGTGFEGATTHAVEFLKAGPATNLLASTVSEVLVTEDAINTISTESGDDIYEEDQQ